MSKKAIGWLYVTNAILQILLTIVFLACLGNYQDLARYVTEHDASTCSVNGTLMTCQASAQLTMDTMKNFMIIIGAFMVIGGLLAMIAWINTLINLSRGQQWAWFILTFFFGGILLFIYLIGGPEVPQKRSPVAQVLASPPIC